MPAGRKGAREAGVQKVREGKEMGTGEWEMHAGRKRAREAGVQKGERKQRNGDRRVGNARRQEESKRGRRAKRREKAKKWGQESEKCPPAGREQERPACKR
ncbi:MAG: hypothetical protein ACLR23_03435 [Clostridia bacterium]